MKFYKVLKEFQSPLVGNKIPGEVFQYGDESAKKWVDLGLIEESKVETKPNPAQKAETKPKKSKGTETK